MKKEKGMKIQHRIFCEGLVYEGLNQTEAYLRAYPKANYNTANSKASLLAGKESISKYINELRDKYIENKQKILESMFPEAMNGLRKMMSEAEYDSDKIKSMIEIVDRVMPKERKSTITFEYTQTLVQKILIVIKEEVCDEPTRNKIARRLSEISISEGGGGAETEGEIRP